MDLELSDDQVALRDGIAALLDGPLRLGPHPRRLRPRHVGRARAAGVFSLGADGFGWADRAVVFEQLGAACVPGPLVAGSLAHGLLDGRRRRCRSVAARRGSCSSSTSTGSTISSCSTPTGVWSLDPATLTRRAVDAGRSIR